MWPCTSLSPLGKDGANGCTLDDTAKQDACTMRTVIQCAGELLPQTGFPVLVVIVSVWQTQPGIDSHELSPPTDLVSRVMKELQ